MLDAGKGFRVQALLAQVIEQAPHDLDRPSYIIALKVGVEAEQAGITEALALDRGAIGQAVAQAQLVIYCPVQITGEQIQGGLVVVVQHRLDEQPVEFGRVAQPAVHQVAPLLGLLADRFQVAAVFRLGGREFAEGSFQVGGQQAVQATHHDQCHVVGRVPTLAQALDLLEGHVVEVGTLGAFQAQFRCQLLPGGVTDVLPVQPAL